MPESTPSPSQPRSDALDASVIAAAGGELLNHLRRGGLRFVPNAITENIEPWSARMIASIAQAESAPTSDPVIPLSPKTSPDPSQSRSPVSSLTPAGGASPATDRFAPVAVVADSENAYAATSLPVIERQARLASMAELVSNCTRCDVLAHCRTQTVFGEGHPRPRFVFLGEGPGADEDETGRPFVGKAGQLLTKMIQACQLTREEVYITNTVKCRPPGNRNPDPTEIANCREYFEQQLEILQPEYIICLGAVPSHALLKTKLSIGRLRQTFHQYRGSKVLVIYHPAYLLRKPDAKRAAWTDLQMLMKDAGLAAKG